jgi:hypothetical protein
MSNFVTLPPEFAALEGRVQWVQQINANEYHSSCPNCGVEPHHNDSRPSDRFVLWVESRESGRPFGMCVRHCGYKWSPNKQDAVWTEEEKAAFATKRRELNDREEERILTYARDVVMKQKIYIRYMETLKNSTYGKQYLYKRGFNSDEWNHWFGYGVIEDYKVRGRNSTYYAPAITMPVVGLSNVVENIKLRVTEAHDPQDRFRNIYKSGNQHPYFPMHDTHVENKVIIIEGEMKANQVCMRGETGLQVIGTQGMGIGARMIYKIESAEVVYLCLDPDAYKPNDKGIIPVVQTARRIGVNRVRLVQCREKVDDALIKGFNLRNAINMAVKVNQL